MAPPHRSDQRIGRTGEGEQRRNRNAYTGAGVNRSSGGRNGTRGDTYRPVYRDGHTRNPAPGGRLADRTTLNDDRRRGTLRDRTARPIPQHGRAPRLQGLIGLNGIPRGPRAHYTAPGNPAPNVNINSHHCPATTTPTVNNTFNSNVGLSQQPSLSVASQATNHDASVTPTTPTSHPIIATMGQQHHQSPLFISSHLPAPPRSPSLSPPRNPTFPATTANTRTPIRMHNTPLLDSSLSPTSNTCPTNEEHTNKLPQQRTPKPYTGKDPIKRAVTNANLRAIFAGKPYPRERKKAGREKPVLRLGMRREMK